VRGSASSSVRLSSPSARLVCRPTKELTMGRSKMKLQAVLYPVFLVTCTTAAGIGLLTIWGVEPTMFVMRLLGSCIVIAVAAAFTMSATRLVTGRAPEDDAG